LAAQLIGRKQALIIWPDFELLMLLIFQQRQFSRES
jgi:hypothetical protein